MRPALVSLVTRYFCIGLSQTNTLVRDNLNAYIAKFKRLSRLAGYNLQNQLVLDKFGSRLTSGLYIAIINSAKEPWNWTVWVHAAQKYQQKYLLIHTSLGFKNQKTLKQWNNPQTVESSLEETKWYKSQSNGHHAGLNQGKKDWCRWENRAHVNRQVLQLQKARTP